MGLDWHLEQSQTYFNLLCGGYDAVVLQHNAHPFPGRESLLAAGERLIALLPTGHQALLVHDLERERQPPGPGPHGRRLPGAGPAHRGRPLPGGGRCGQAVRAAHPEEELYFADGEHSSVLGASLAGAVIGRALLGLETDPRQCYQDAKALAQLALDPRMIDMVLRDGRPAMEALGP